MTLYCPVNGCRYYTGNSVSLSDHIERVHGRIP
jgi:hypothetical protein